MIQQFILPAILIILAGMAEGKMDLLLFRNNSSNRFWGNDAWLSKYRHREPSDGLTFIGKYFTFLTDGWHLMKFLNHLLLFSSISILVSLNYEGYSVWHYVVVGLGAWGINRCGFSVIWLFLK